MKTFELGLLALIARSSTAQTVLLAQSESCRVKEGVVYHPQQLHLAYAGASAGTGMMVSWATYADVKDSALWVGCSENELKLADINVKTLEYYHDENYTMFHHHAIVSSLTPHTKYYYKVGSETQTPYQSDVHSFITVRSPSDPNTFKAIIYGDAGDGNNSVDTLAYMNTLSTGDFDFIYHIGDISYADDDFLVDSQVDGFFYEAVYNKWVNSLAPVMSSIPYMVVVGNHDMECHSPSCLEVEARKEMLSNFSAYNARWKMPYEESDGALNMWYSFDHGPIHLTSLSSESDYPNSTANAFIIASPIGNFGDQLAWLEADLKKADANRNNVPWVFVGMHRPIYNVGGCDNGVPSSNTGQNGYLQSAFESLLIKYKVDVVLMGHEHYYERQVPIANNTAVMDGVSADNKTYVNPQAPVYILTGAAGNIEGIDPAPENSAPWNAAFDYTNFGFSTLEANRTMLSWKFIKSSDESVLDEFVMWKTS
ncbi:hypothetical protein JM18_004992 [Phytophthora kernoviae]|uniref:Purple acid phosphatase n=2 Tax=Phytophthora kernoviae TaxID=325452 RepID=A0A921V8G6_9STRA|nr:hypothetical protein G195_011238 [Phytophthora kernoviae 00238/432]KAG2525200.1 hypothetical protein JM18_004992 [Phytophthora kernoviae]